MSCYIFSSLCFLLPFLSSLFQAGKQKAGKGRKEESSARADVKGRSPSDRLKYHSFPGARHRLWCSEGVCDKSGVILRERGRVSASERPPGNQIDQVLLTESSTVGKSSSLMLCCLYSLISFEGNGRNIGAESCRCWRISVWFNEILIRRI